MVCKRKHKGPVLTSSLMRLGLLVADTEGHRQNRCACPLRVHFYVPRFGEQFGIPAADPHAKTAPAIHTELRRAK